VSRGRRQVGRSVTRIRLPDCDLLFVQPSCVRFADTCQLHGRQAALGFALVEVHLSLFTGGPRVSTPEMPEPVRHSLMEPAYGVSYGNSLRDPKYEYRPLRFAGWDPRSFGNSLGSSLRDPPYQINQKKRAN
jgi:hypothetical protein